MNLGTPGATKVVGSLGLLAVAALGWVVAVGPQTARLGEVREEITTVQDQNMVLEAQLAALQKQQEELAGTRRTAQRLAVKFPATADQPGLFREVTAAAVDAGIGADGVTALAPTPPELGTDDEAAGAATDTAATDSAASTTTDPTSGSALARQTVTVTVEGSYDETRRLLANLEQMPRAYLVTTVALTGDPTTGTYTTTVTGDMFVMPPVPDPGKTVNLASTTDPEE